MLNQVMKIIQAFWMRMNLHRYSFGEQLGSVQFEGLPVSDMTQLRIGLFGPTGSGKSSFISACERAIRQTAAGTVLESSAGGEGTIILEDFLPEMFFKLVDTRGFFNYDSDESCEFRDILAGRIKSGDVIRRGNYRTSGEDVDFVNVLHGVIFVLKATDVRLGNGRLEQYLRPLREILKNREITPITVVTHGDKISPSAGETILHQAFAATGSPCLFLFTNTYCLANTTCRLDTDIAVFTILNTALRQAENFVKQYKQRRKQRAEMELARARTLSRSSTAVGQIELDVFLSIMRSKDASFSVDVHDEILRTLRENEINNLQTLALCWEDVRLSAITDPHARNRIQQELQELRLI